MVIPTEAMTCRPDLSFVGYQPILCCHAVARTRKGHKMRRVVFEREEVDRVLPFL